MPQTDKQITGQKGEELAAEYLRGKGHVIRETNYWKKWGELDVISELGGVIHFVEVKTVTRLRPKASAGKSGSDYWEPEDNIHPWKRQRLGRAIQTYLLERKIGDEVEWQVDSISVYLTPEGKVLKIEAIEDICL